MTTYWTETTRGPLASYLAIYVRLDDGSIVQGIYNTIHLPPPSWPWILLTVSRLEDSE